MRALAGLVVLMTGCYSPAPATNAPCNAALECPSGQRCDTTQSPPLCISELIDAGVDPDAPRACETSTDCTGTAPVCDLASHECRGCVADSECNGVCTEYSGACVGNGQAIFVSPMGSDSGNCTESSPCMSFSYAFTQLTQNRRTIRIGDGMYMTTGSPAMNVTNTNGRIVLSGEDSDPAGAVFTAVSNGTTNPITIGVSGGTDVVIEGITIRDGTNTGLRSQGALLLYRTAIIANRRGIEHQPNNMQPLHIWDSVIEMSDLEGVTSQDGPLEVLRSVVRGNVLGGMRIQKSAATIISSMFLRNGGSAGIGGMRFEQAQGTVVISFVTVAFNMTGASNVPGIAADTNVAIDNSIITDNFNGTTPAVQICSGCTATYSLFSGTPPIGEGNIEASAGFVDVAGNDFHLMSTSPARDTANPAATVLYDVDGDPRPLGTGFDIGADEVVP